MSPLDKKVFQLGYGGGLDTKTDAATLPLGKWLVLENCTFAKPQSLHKRNGYTQLGANLPAGQAIMAYKDQLLAASADTLYPYGQQPNSFTASNTPQFVSATVSKTSIVRTQYEQIGASFAVLSGQIACVFETDGASNGSCIKIIDQATGKTLFFDGGGAGGRLGSNVYGPRVFTLGSNFVVVAYNASTNRIVSGILTTSGITLTPLTPTSGNTQVKAPTPPATLAWDVALVQTASGPRVYVVYNDSTPTTGGVSAFYLTAAAPTTPVALANITAETGFSVGVFGDLFQQAPVFLIWNGTLAKYRAYNAALSLLLSSGTLDTPPAPSLVSNLVGVSTSASAIAWSIFIACPPPGVSTDYGHYLIRLATVTAGYTISAGVQWMRTVDIASKPFVYNGIAYILLSHTSLLQSTYFLIGAPSQSPTSWFMVAKMLNGTAGGPPWTRNNGATKHAALPDPVSLGGSLWLFPVRESASITVLNGVVQTMNGITGITLNFFDPQNSYQRATLADTIHWSGGFLQMFDGLNSIEHGFHTFPENLFSDTPGGSVVYQYVAIYRWTDNLGQTHRSAPSPAITQKMASAIGGLSPASVTVPYLEITTKQQWLSGISPPTINIDLYRTLANGTVFYKAVTVPNVVNSPSSNVNGDVTISDTVSDAILGGNEQLYTTGGVIENIAPDAVTAMITADSRIWYIDPLTGSIGYSKQVVPGSPVEFSDLLKFNVDQGIGPPTALGVLDGKKIIFRASGMSYLVGIGPDNLGGQNDLVEYRITTDVGCTNPRSVVFTPDGLMFQSSKGICLLNRSLQTVYVGAPVEAYNSQTVTSALLMPTLNQVRFTMSGGVVLVYDYFMGQWSVFLNIAAVDATIWQGNYVYLTAAGAVQKESASFADPGGAFIPMKAVSPWIQLAGVQGFQRIYRLLLLAAFKSAHRLAVKLAYNFVNVFTQTTNFDVATDPTPYQKRVHCATQKCQAIQISVEDLSTGTNGESLTLSALAIEVGAKRGAMKVPAAQSAG